MCIDDFDDKTVMFIACFTIGDFMMFSNVKRYYETIMKPTSQFKAHDLDQVLDYWTWLMQSKFFFVF